MWSFKKKSQNPPADDKDASIEWVDPKTIGFSQLDLSEREDDYTRIKPGDWLETTPMAASLSPDDKRLPRPEAPAEEIYAFAAKLSDFREQYMPMMMAKDPTRPEDGVYCPICHICTVGLDKLQTPCPKCGRHLLRFGWT